MLAPSRSLFLAAVLRRALPATALVATVLAPVVAEATLSRELTLRQLVEQSDVVLTGTAVEAKAVWEDVPDAGRRIVTYTRMKVDDVAFGDASDSVWVRTLGGVVGDIGQHVDGEAALGTGERALLFLHKTDAGNHVVVAMAQGHYVVREENKLAPSPHLGGLVRSRRDTVYAREQLVGRVATEAMDLVRSERKAAGK